MSKTKIKPLGNRILVKRSEAVKTKGGILLPDTAQEKPKEGKVVAVGPGKGMEDGSVEAMEVSVGDRVLFGPYAGTEVSETSSEDPLLIMSADDVLGVLC